MLSAMVQSSNINLRLVDLSINTKSFHPILYVYSEMVTKNSSLFFMKLVYQWSYSLLE